MLTEIEEAVQGRLNTKLTSVSRVAIDEAHSPLTIKLPGVDVIVGGGVFEKVGQHRRLKPSVYVIVTFSNLRSVADRRKGVYPILESIVALLARNNLGLAIDPLIPKRLDNITEKEEAADAKIVFQLEFETGFVIEEITDEVATDLLRVGLNYYLATPDGEIGTTADATDNVTLSS